MVRQSDAPKKGLRLLTSRELFRKALDKVKALNDTAQAKADLFAAEARQIEAATGGAWTAQQMRGINGEHIFVGSAGEMLVITPTTQLFRGRLDLTIHAFVPPDQIKLDYTQLIPI